MKVYVASSWRNEFYEGLLAEIRLAMFDVYDFKAEPGAFAWADLDPAWERWDVRQFADALEHPLAVRAFKADTDGMMHADACVLLLPSGRSARIESMSSNHC